MNRYIKYVALISLCAVTCSLTSCSALFPRLKHITLLLNVDKEVEAETYNNLDKAVRVVAKSNVNVSDVQDMENLSKSLRKVMSGMEMSFSPSVSVFAKEATENYLQSMGVDISQKADYCVNIDVRKMQIIYLDSKGQSAEYRIQLTGSLVDDAGQSLVNFGNITGSFRHKAGEIPPAPFGAAFNDAMSKINWYRVADNLRVAKTAKQEKNAQVTGAGDTALEHTVIRWNILSSPQGADVSWRVVSSTPEVANTNSNFVGTTPYESTESFDIRGLTYNNSGNVQIEVTCEKAGYLSQRKRFNLRQAIDQKEISAKFNLVKDE